MEEKRKLERVLAVLRKGGKGNRCTGVKGVEVGISDKIAFAKTQCDNNRPSNPLLQAHL